MMSHNNKIPGTIAKKSPVTAPSSSSNTEATEDAYKQLKRKIKEMTELNVAMSRDYFHAKRKIRILTFERNLLLDNIGRMESSSNLTDESDSDIYSDLSYTDDDIDGSTVISSRAIATNAKPALLSARTLKKPINTPATIASSSNSTDYATNASDTTSLPTTRNSSPHPPPHKRSKLTPQSMKTRRVQPLERDSKGYPKLPQQIGVLTVHHLGTIVTDRPNYHNERYIFPVGYSVSRTYPSMVDPNNNTVITSSIIDGGDYPRFQVTAADMPHDPIVANSATGAWTVVVRRSNEIRHREHSNSASGPDYYGFKHPTIAKLIQDLPGAKKLKHYVWQTFEEMEPRAAKGVMAAAEKKRGNLEQMGSANRKVPSNHPSSSSSSKIAPRHHQSAFIYEMNDVEEGQAARAQEELGEEEEEEVDELAASDKEDDT